MRVSEIARQLGKLGGSVKSKAKAKAARQNGRLGGRPKNRSKPTTSSRKSLKESLQN
jgi:hypothetical protein